MIFWYLEMKVLKEVVESWGICWDNREEAIELMLSIE